MHVSKFISGVLAPFAIVVAAVAASVAMFETEPRAAQDHENKPRLVSVLSIEAESTTSFVHGTGVVEPSRRIEISSEVGGRVVGLSDHLVLGGRLAAGELLVRVDPRASRLDIQSQRAAVERARVGLELEQARGRAAEREWKVLEAQRTPSSDGGRLVVRAPQLEDAQAGVLAAKLDLERAQVGLSHTTIQAPFNTVVVEESVEVGQVVQPGAPIATLIGVDQFLVRVSLSMDDVARLQLPADDDEGDHDPPRATVIQRYGSHQSSTWDARVIRLLGALDPQTQRAHVLVAVDRPLDRPRGQPPLLPGAFVDVEIEGPTLSGIHKIPRAAVVDGHQVLVADGDDTLARRVLEIRWADENFVYAASGLEDGDRVVADRISTVVEGAPLRTTSVKTVSARGSETTAAQTPQTDRGHDD